MGETINVRLQHIGNLPSFLHKQIQFDQLQLHQLFAPWASFQQICHRNKEKTVYSGLLKSVLLTIQCMETDRMMVIIFMVFNINLHRKKQERNA